MASKEQENEILVAIASGRNTVRKLSVALGLYPQEVSSKLQRLKAKDLVQYSNRVWCVRKGVLLFFVLHPFKISSPEIPISLPGCCSSILPVFESRDEAEAFAEKQDIPFSQISAFLFR